MQLLYSLAEKQRQSMASSVAVLSTLSSTRIVSHPTILSHNLVSSSPIEACPVASMRASVWRVIKIANAPHAERDVCQTGALVLSCLVLYCRQRAEKRERSRKAIQSRHPRHASRSGSRQSSCTQSHPSIKGRIVQLPIHSSKL